MDETTGLGPMLLDVRSVAALLDCSTRTVRRLADSGRMPAPIKVAALLRWRRDAIEEWIAGGCKPLARRGGRSMR